MANNGTYYVRASAGDDQGLSNGGWSPWTMFYTAYGTPPDPTISCPGYGNGSWTDSPPTNDVVCTISAPGVAGDYATPGYLDLTVDGVKKPRLKISPSNTANVASATVTILKGSEGAHSITATAVARTGLLSAPVTHAFGWGGAALSAPVKDTGTSGKVTVTAGGPPKGGASSVTGTIQWRLAGDTTSPWRDGQDVQMTLPATGPVTGSVAWNPTADLQAAGENTRRPALLEVQVCFTYAGVPQPRCTWGQSPRTVTWVPHAFGNGYPVADAGPGQVALFTGEFNTSAADVSVPGYSGDLAISRSHTSFAGNGTVANWPADPVTGVFGPGWTAALEGPEAGGAGLQVIDNTRQDGTIALVDEEGGALV